MRQLAAPRSARRGRHFRARLAILLVAMVAGLGLGPVPAWADDPLTRAVQDAYAPYRQALFRTSSGPAEAAAQAVATARAAWGTVVARFRSPPPPFDRDRELDATFAAVAAAYAKATEAVGRGALPEAHQELEAIRDLLAEARRRNNVIVYSDHVNAFHASMERALVLAGGAGTPSVDEARELAGVLAFLAARLESAAPAALRETAEFAPALARIGESVRAFRDAARAGEPDALRDAAARLRPAFAPFFVRFG